MRVHVQLDLLDRLTYEPQGVKNFFATPRIRLKDADASWELFFQRTNIDAQLRLFVSKYIIFGFIKMVLLQGKLCR